MLLILKKTIFDLITPTILYAVNLWLKPVSATGARASHDKDPFQTVFNEIVTIFKHFLPAMREGTSRRHLKFNFND